MESNVSDTMPVLSIVERRSSNRSARPLNSPPRGSIQAMLTPARRKLAHQFFRFGVVGAFGFLLDNATVYGLQGVAGKDGATLISYFFVASINWLVNRLWTFRGIGSAGSALRQWSTFLLANSLGFVLNRGTALALIHTVPLCSHHLVLALAAGTAAGMFSNFTMSRRLVFR